MPRRSRRPRKNLVSLVADLVADLVVFAVHVSGTTLLRIAGLRRDKGQIDRTPGSYRACYHKLDEVPATCAHTGSASIVAAISAPISAPTSPRRRNRYHNTIPPSEKIKMI